MFSLGRILLPIDFSERRLAAARYAGTHIGKAVQL